MAAPVISSSMWAMGRFISKESVTLISIVFGKVIGSGALKQNAEVFKSDFSCFKHAIPQDSPRMLSPEAVLA